jgi:hypothetical protein
MLLAIDLKPLLQSAIDGIVVINFTKRAGLQPSPDNLPTLRLGLRWAVFLHHRPGGSAFGGIVTRIALPIRQPSVDFAQRSVERFGIESIPGVGYPAASKDVLGR